MLTIKDLMTLRLERSWWKYAGAKEHVIRDLFSESSTRYYQRLNTLLDQPARSSTTRCWSAGSGACARLVRRLARLGAGSRRWLFAGLWIPGGWVA